MTTVHFKDCSGRKPQPSVVLARLNKDESVTVYEATGGISYTDVKHGHLTARVGWYTPRSSRETRRFLTPAGIEYVSKHCWAQRPVKDWDVTGKLVDYYSLTWIALPARFIRPI